MRALSSHYLKPIWCLNPLKVTSTYSSSFHHKPSTDTYYDPEFQLQTLNVPSKKITKQLNISVHVRKSFALSLLRTNVCVTPLYSRCMCVRVSSKYSVQSNISALASYCHFPPCRHGWRIYWQSQSETHQIHTLVWTSVKFVSLNSVRWVFGAFLHFRAVLLQKRGQKLTIMWPYDAVYHVRRVRTTIRLRLKLAS